LEIDHGRDLIFYGSFWQGLEDSALAPVSAKNRNEPPRDADLQVDGGIRWAPSARLRLSSGLSTSTSRTSTVDADMSTPCLAAFNQRGLETSLSFNERGLTGAGRWLLPKPRVDRVIPNRERPENIPPRGPCR